MNSIFFVSTRVNPQVLCKIAYKFYGGVFDDDLKLCEVTTTPLRIRLLCGLKIVFINIKQDVFIVFKFKFPELKWTIEYVTDEGIKINTNVVLYCFRLKHIDKTEVTR